MAEVELAIGGRHYTIACRDGGEDHLRWLARHVDLKAQEAAAAVGNVNETRQLLFAALLLADELAEARDAARRAPVEAEPPAPAIDPALGAALATLADRIEAIADGLEANPKTP